MTSLNNCLCLLLILILTSCKTSESNTDTNSENEWISIFNGTDLTGWTPKIAGYASGEDPFNTFRVVDGAITVSYENYDTFTNEFGHLFYDEILSNYHLKLKYRFFGDQVAGGQGWAFKNSGVMYHGQLPDSMDVDQGFPVSLEGQFLGGNGIDERSTGNLCTPGMDVVIDGETITDHCISSSSKTIHDDQWVDFELIVKNNEYAHHIINGDTVFTFENPTYGGRFLPEEMSEMAGLKVYEGTISLQSESHPIQFKDIELLRLK